MRGVVHTRVGYAGGTTADPTYQSIGDHTETVQVDYDPLSVSYEELLAVFWASHRPTTPPPSRQYASRIFAHDEAQLRAAEESKRIVESKVGRVFTEVVPYERLYLAEDYHQKYRLRNEPRLYREFREVYQDAAAFRESTAAARVNGYLYGYGSPGELEAELPALGLSADGEAVLRSLVRSRAERLGGVVR